MGANLGRRAMDLMFQPLRKYADFNGRARRSEYWLFHLFVFVVEMVLGSLTTSMVDQAAHYRC